MDQIVTQELRKMIASAGKPVAPATDVDIFIFAEPTELNLERPFRDSRPGINRPYTKRPTKLDNVLARYFHF
jgi:hypothetical protein